jgi:hypothetical protein
VVTVKLPKRPNPEFSGDSRKWPTFWQSFQVSVDDQPIADVQKMDYLLSMLKGDAARAVEGYSLTAQNYPVVIDVLTRRFGDPRRITEALQSELFNLPS